MKLELETYTPSEAEAITEVKQATVRNWRRAGHLPTQKGHARYNLADMLVMFVMQLLVSRGVSPEAAKEFAGEAAKAIFQSAIWIKDIYSSNVSAIARESVSPPQDYFIADFEESEGSEFPFEDYYEALTLELMVKAAEKKAGISGLKRPDWLAIWADGSPEFFYDDQDPHESFFSNIQYGAAYIQGPVLLFCLGALAAMVVDRLPRPAFRLNEEG